MSNDTTNQQDNDNSPSNEQPSSPPLQPQQSSEQPSFSFNESQSTPNIVTSDINSRPNQTYPLPDHILTSTSYTDKACRVCSKKFGVRRMRRKHSCRRCLHKVCGNCSSKKRYDSKTDQMVRVCDNCLSAEHCIVMTHRLRNLKLKHNKRNRGTYIVKVAQSSKEYFEGLINKCKIIEINEQNVESLNAQLIADKLNTIKIPFSITLDYSEAEIKHDQLKKLNGNKNNDKTDKKDGKTPIKNDNKAIGTSRLMNAQQNPTNPYYYGPPQAFAAPVIVTGPSNDIRSMYKLPPLQSYSDSYNEQYNDMGVIYDESPQKKQMNGRHIEDTDDEEEVSNSENEEETESDTDNDNTEGTPELMQYEDDEHTEDSDDEVEHAQSDDNNGGELHLDIDEVERPRHTRSKSVPGTPTTRMKLDTTTDVIQSVGTSVVPETPLIAMTLSHGLVDNDIKTSVTPKGNKSTNNVFHEKRPRSLSQDNMDPTSPPLMPIQSEIRDNSKKKKKRKRKDKEKKKKKLTKGKYFRKKQHRKCMENYMNLHNNYSKPVITSNINDYTTQALNPPHHHQNTVKDQSMKHKYMAPMQQRQRMEMTQQHIAQSAHIFVNPYRQFSITLNKRPLNISLQYRNAFTSFMAPTTAHIQQSHTLTRSEYIWGWYSVNKHSNIPIGSKLLSINFDWIYGKTEQEITRLMYNSILPITLIFEAPSYLNHVPPSIHLQLTDKEKEEEKEKECEEYLLNILNVFEYISRHKCIIYWWLEEGGFILICLSILGLIVLNAPFYSKIMPILIAFLTILMMSIPQKKILDVLWSIIHLLIFKLKRRRRGSALTLFGWKVFNTNSPNVSVSTEQSLLNPYIESPHPFRSHHNQRRSKSFDYKDDINRKKKKQMKKQILKEEEEDDDDDVKLVEAEEEEDKEEDFDPNWETNICFPGGNTEKWGSYGPCSAKTLKLRGATYLNDRIKINSKESLLSLANMDIFTVHDRIHHLAQNEVSWFYQNRDKLPRSLFFIIIHLRLDSMSVSIVQYFYIDRNKFKHLIENNDSIKEVATEKGSGYFAVGSDSFDCSGYFWNFINGTCKYRNDRLKLLARKEEGPWYMQIPGRPAIIGKQVPIEYYRGYNANHLNSTKIHNTRSAAYPTYDFKTLYHDPNSNNDNNNDNNDNIPCDCGKCLWINTNGEYPDYLEIDITPEVNSVAKRCVQMACPLAKSLQIEMHWTLEGQINNVELPERMLCSARLIHVDLNKLVELD